MPGFNLNELLLSIKIFAYYFRWRIQFEKMKGLPA